MTHDQQPPIIPATGLDADDETHASEAQARRRVNLTWVIPAVAAAVAVVFGAGWVSGYAYSPEPASPATTATTTVEEHLLGQPPAAGGETGPEPTTEAPTVGPTPQVKDITLTVKVTDKQCFGLAGCNVDIKLDLGYVGPSLSPDDTFEVTYQVTGDESGPIIGTLELTGDQYTVPEHSLSTRSSRTKILVKVTGVDKVGI